MLLKHYLFKAFPMYSINNSFSSFSPAMYSFHPPLTWFVQKLPILVHASDGKLDEAWEQGYGFNKLYNNRFVLNNIFGFLIPVLTECPL